MLIVVYDYYCNVYFYTNKGVIALDQNPLTALPDRTLTKLLDFC